MLFACLHALSDPTDSDGAQDDTTMVISFVHRGEEAVCRPGREGREAGEGREGGRQRPERIIISMVNSFILKGVVVEIHHQPLHHSSHDL